MTLSDLNRIHFIGIGGIGMSALARFCLFNGKRSLNNIIIQKEIDFLI